MQTKKEQEKEFISTVKLASDLEEYNVTGTIQSEHAVTSYSKIWTDEDYKRFHDALVIFKEASHMSNTKIAKYMGEHIDPIRVRLERSKH